MAGYGDANGTVMLNRVNGPEQGSFDLKVQISEEISKEVGGSDDVEEVKQIWRAKVVDGFKSA